jgi:type IV pilus assembly protein PilB
MGIEPFLLTGCLLGVLAQRLVKRNCPHCLEIEPVNPLVRKALHIADDEVFFHSVGCEQCNHSGIAGRLAVYEILRISDNIRKLIHKNASDMEIEALAISNGMLPLTENALTKARNKDISLAEVYRVRLD